MTLKNSLHLLGMASGLGAQNVLCSEGPQVLQHSSVMSELREAGLEIYWDAILSPKEAPNSPLRLRISELCQRIAEYTRAYAQAGEMFAVIGGDHTCAMGTWSGVHAAIAPQGSLGLIWVDAHMDSHTPETTETGAIHGMPLAALLGYGDPIFTRLVFPTPKLLPENICIIGARSYEHGEHAFLKERGVRIFYKEEIDKRGIAAVFAEAVALVKQNTAAYGISLDLDVFDPQEVPGVGSRAAHGLAVDEFCEVLASVNKDPRLIGFEIAEFNPSRDEGKRTEMAIKKIMAAILGEV